MRLLHNNYLLGTSACSTNQTCKQQQITVEGPAASTEPRCAHSTPCSAIYFSTTTRWHQSSTLPASNKSRPHRPKAIMPPPQPLCLSPSPFSWHRHATAHRSGESRWHAASFDRFLSIQQHKHCSSGAWHLLGLYPVLQFSWIMNNSPFTPACRRRFDGWSVDGNLTKLFASHLTQASTSWPLNDCYLGLGNRCCIVIMDIDATLPSSLDSDDCFNDE